MGHILVVSASPVLWDTTHSWVAYLDIPQYVSRVRAKGGTDRGKLYDHPDQLRKLVRCAQEPRWAATGKECTLT